MKDKEHTDEEMRELAKRMVNPLRCGGAWTEDGQWYYIFMGSKLNEEQWKALRGLNQEELSAKIEEYKRLGIITKHPHFLTRSLARQIKAKRTTIEQATTEYELTQEEILEIKELLEE